MGSGVVEGVKPIVRVAEGGIVGEGVYVAVGTIVLVAVKGESVAVTVLMDSWDVGASVSTGIQPAARIMTTTYSSWILMPFLI